jgi:hypothetical protein
MIPETLSTEQINSAMAILAAGVVTMASLLVLTVVVIALGKAVCLFIEYWRVL